MKMKQIADRIGKHDNTVRNYAKQFAEFLSPEPPKGESRIFTDSDLRILGFVSRLSDSGMSYDEINQALKRKMSEGSPFPPILPIASSAETQGLITIAEAESRLVIKDAKIAELEARLEELRKQIEQFREERREERDAYTDQVGKLNQIIGGLQAELKALREK